MAQNEHLPFVDSIYEIWLSKSVDTNFERFLLRNFCSNAFSECVAFYRLILNEDGTVKMASYIDSNFRMKKVKKHHNTNIKFENKLTFLIT